jgi:hypothetical protein
MLRSTRVHWLSPAVEFSRSRHVSPSDETCALPSYFVYKRDYATLTLALAYAERSIAGLVAVVLPLSTS